MIIDAIILVYYHHEIIVTTGIHTGLFHIIRLKNLVIFGLGILLCLTLGLHFPLN